MIQRLGAFPLLFVLLARAGDPPKFQAELQRYREALGPICRTGVRPEMLERYREAAAALEAANYGGGQDNNFWGLKTPERVWLECFQSPGDMR